MANARDVDLDIVGHDKTSRATRSAANNFDKLRRKVDSNNKATKKLINTSTLATRALGDMARGTVVATGAVAAAGSATLTAAPYLIKFTTAILKTTAAIAPAAAALLPLAAGFALVKRTVGAIGPAMGEALKPIAKGLEDSEKAAAKLADNGLKPLARQFVKVNLPAVAKAQARIAVALNESARFALKWVNSAAGQKVVNRLTKDTAGLFERLAPSVSGVAVSMGLLAGRVSKVSFRQFGSGAEYALTKLQGLMDSISAKDVEDAFTKMRDLGRQAGAGLRKIGDGLAWIETHEKAILAVKSALGALAVVVGILAGNPIIALAGGASLLVTWWTRLKAASKAVRDKLVDLYNSTPQLQQAFQTLSEAGDLWRIGVENFLRYAGPGLKSFAKDVQPLLRELAPIFADIAKRLAQFGAAALTVAGVVIGAFAWVAGKVALAIAAMIRGFRTFKTYAAMWLLKTAQVALAVVAAIGDAFGRLPGPIGKAFRDAAAKAKEAAGAIGRSINGIKLEQAKNKVEDLKARLAELGRQKPTPKVNADIAAMKEKLRQARQALAQLDGSSADVWIRTHRQTYYGTTGKPPTNPHGDSAGGNSFARTSPGSGSYRTGGATQIAAPNVNTYVTLDGREIASAVRVVIDQAQGRQSFRARSGRR